MRFRRVVPAVAIACLLIVTGCSSSSSSHPSSSNEKVDKALHDQLPAGIKSSGVLKVVTLGAQPPWFLPGSGANSYTGAGPQLADAIGAVLGVKISYGTNADISAAIATVQSGRYDVGFGPFGDTTGKGAAVTKSVEYVDFVKEFVPFLVKKGNPKQIQSLDTVCGATVAAQANGGAYVLLEKQAAKCKSAGKPTLTVLGQDGVPAGVLAVQSGRADAFFSSGAPLIYYSQHAKGALELAGTGSDNGFTNLFQGSVVPKDSPLANTLLAAFKKIFADGTYKTIMTNAGLTKEMIDAPAVNLASTSG